MTNYPSYISAFDVAGRTTITHFVHSAEIRTQSRFENNSNHIITISTHTIHLLRIVKVGISVDLILTYSGWILSVYMLVLLHFATFPLKAKPYKGSAGVNHRDSSSSR